MTRDPLAGIRKLIRQHELEVVRGRDGTTFHGKRRNCVRRIVLEGKAVSLDFRELRRRLNECTNARHVGRRAIEDTGVMR